MEAYMRLIKRHKRCPHCDGTQTRKHGLLKRKRTKPDHAKVPIQRWYCHVCKRAFAEVRSIHSYEYAPRAANHYFVGRASYRNTARQLRIDRMTAYAHIRAVCERTKFPWELSTELKPSWGGHLLVDSDEIIVGDHKEYILLAVDSATRDIPTALVTKQQGIDDWKLLFDSLTHVSYPFKSITSDGFSSIVHAIKHAFPKLPHQLCVKHFYDETYRFLRYRPHRMHLHSKHVAMFMRQLHHILFARSFMHFRGELTHVLNHPVFNSRDFKDVISRLTQHTPYFLPHFYDHNIPRTTNIIENVISQLDLKLNPIIKFGSHESAWNTIKCLFAWYRFKKFSNCRKRYKHHNGKAPLELAGVQLKQSSWIYQAMRQF